METTVSRRKLGKNLSPSELARIVEAAEAFHHALIAPRLGIGAHSRLLTDMNQHALHGIEALTGKPAPFIQWYGTAPGAPTSASSA
jgi:hypothetical protein